MGHPIELVPLSSEHLKPEVSPDGHDLEDFFENSVVAMHLVAADGTILRVNQAELDLLGYRREEYVGRHIAEFHADPAAIDDILKRLSCGESLDKYPARLRTKNGTLKNVIISSSVQFRNGEFLNTRCVTLDVTGERRTEEALRESEARLSAELDAIRQLQGISVELIHDQGVEALYDKLVDAAVVIMRADYASMQMLYPDRGAKGELRLLAYRGFNPEAVKFWEWVRADSGCTCGIALRTGRRAIASDVESCDFMAGTPDRATYLQAGMNAAQSTPLVSRTGRLLGMISTHWRKPHIPTDSDLRRLDVLARQAADLMERGQAEEQLRRQFAIIESSDDAIVSKDLNGIIVSWNGGAQRLFGYSAEEVLGKPVTILIPDAYQDEEPKILERIRRGERIDHYETVRQRKDGSLIDISLTVSPVKDGRGKIVGASKIARDIGERKRAQEQQSLLLREMSHRVKNLFAVTSALISLSARSARTPQDMAASVQKRLAALTRAHELTRPGLIDGKSLAGQNTTLHTLLRMLFEPYVVQRTNGSEGIIITGLDLPIGGTAITSLSLVLHELATNAAKYGALSSLGGVVHIDCSQEQDGLVLLWKERGGPALKAEPDGEGFGGFLTRRIIVDQFGGEFSRDWQPEGLTVRLSVPRERLNP